VAQEQGRLALEVPATLLILMQEFKAP